MKYRRFGRTNWMVSEIGYGMWGVSDWTGSDDSEKLDFVANPPRRDAWFGAVKNRCKDFLEALNYIKYANSS